MTEIESLVEVAQEVRERAYAPYSRYHVGAAVLDREGRIFAGVNVENLSYGLTVCAERSAIAGMATAGGRVIRAVAVATRDGGTPCGACLQTLLEFSPTPAEVLVICVADDGTQRNYRLNELIPHGFASAL